jgi:hypothetical protein
MQLISLFFIYNVPAQAGPVTKQQTGVMRKGNTLFDVNSRSAFVHYSIGFDKYLMKCKASVQVCG